MTAAAVSGCVEVRELAFALADGELTAGIEAAVRAHVEGCPACRDAVARDDAFVRWMRSRVAPVATPLSLRGRIARLLDASVAAPTPADVA